MLILTLAPLVTSQRMQSIFELRYELFSDILERNDTSNQACIPRKHLDKYVSSLKLKINYSFWKNPNVKSEICVVSWSLFIEIWTKWLAQNESDFPAVISTIHYVQDGRCTTKTPRAVVTVEVNIRNRHDISCHSGLRMDSLAKWNENACPPSLGTLHNAWAGAGLHRETLWAWDQARERKCTDLTISCDIIHHRSICFSYVIWALWSFCCSCACLSCTWRDIIQ